MIITKEVGVRMTKEYFEIKGLKWSNSSTQIQKRTEIFSSKSYQDAKNEFMKNLLGRECIDMLSIYIIT